MVRADSEPDGWARQVILRANSKLRKEKKDLGIAFDNSPSTSLDFLLAVDDFSRIGALRFQDESGVFQRGSVKGKRTAPPLVEFDSLARATRAVETHTETAADLEYPRGRGTSLGGLRPKCTVIDKNGFLHAEKNQWRLSPAFDINPFPDKRRVLKTWIAESMGDAASIQSLMEVAPYFGIDSRRACALLSAVEGAVAGWRQIGKEIGMKVSELNAFEAAFEHEERLSARRSIGLIK